MPWKQNEDGSGSTFVAPEIQTPTANELRVNVLNALPPGLVRQAVCEEVWSVTARLEKNCAILEREVHRLSNASPAEIRRVEAQGKYTREVLKMLEVIREKVGSFPL